MRFPALTDEQVAKLDFFNNHDAHLALDLLQNLPYIERSPDLAAGATGVTTSDYFFIAPSKGKVLKVDFLTTIVQTGTGNTPVVKLVNGVNDVAVTGAIALGGAIGDVHAAVIDANYEEFAAGDVLHVSIVNPSATITVGLAGKLQFIWRAIP